MNRRLLPIVSALALSACTYTAAGSRPTADGPAPSSFHPRVEYAVGEFTFALNQRDPKPSRFDGHRLSDEIMQSWRERGFAREARYVDGGFSGEADFNITLTGNMHAETSFGWQLVNALTLMLWPYSVTNSYDLHFVVQEPGSKRVYAASMTASDKTWVEILFVLTLPWAERGHRETMRYVGDDLYSQLQRKGAFDRDVVSPGIR